MKKYLFGLMSAVLSMSVLTACNMNGNEGNEPEDVNYSPVRYEQNNDLDRNGYNDVDMDRDMNDMDLDTDPRDVRNQNEVDTPFNMDEEEPDLDEEPSEERRGD